MKLRLYIRRSDLITFDENSGILLNAAEKILNKVVSLTETYIDLCRNFYLPDMKISLEKLIAAESSKLKNSFKVE